MADVTVHPQTLSSKLSEEKEGKQEEKKEERIVLSPSIAIILENPLFSIDPLLLIRICSFLDMLSAMRFECVSLRLSKFLRKIIKLQSLHQTNTDYYIDHALHSSDSTDNKNSKDEEEEEEHVLPIYSELKYRFPNHNQYDHYILLETDKNIFGRFQHIRQLYLRIIPPNSKDLISNPSSSYLRKYHQHKQQNQQNQPNEKKNQELDEEMDENMDKNMDYLLLNSAKKRDFSNRAPITKVETSIYSRSIFAYFDNYFNKINHLIIEFDPYLFTSTFLTFNIPKILSKIKKLSLIKTLETNKNRYKNGMSSCDIYCHECVSLLQYTRHLKELVFNFPLSSDFYPVVNNLESLKVMHRIESIIDNDNSTNSPNSPYAQNIVTINNNNTTIISNVKLQESLIKYFSPSIKSLHLHGSKGLLNAFNILSDEILTDNITNKNKVFFGLNELCIHCSDSIYQFIYRYMNIVPQLKRLQLVFGKNSNVKQCINILRHFHNNCVLNMTFNPNHDNLLTYYYNYYIYYGLNISNCAKQLRFLYLVTKKTTHYQNYHLLYQLCHFLKETRITLLHIRLLIQYSYWNTSDLMNVIEMFAKNHFIFGRDSMSYQIIMPLKRKYKQPSQSQIKNKIKNIKDEYQYKQNEKYQSIGHNENNISNNISNTAVNKSYNGVIDKNSLKGLASYVKQKNVGTLHVINSNNNNQNDDTDIVIIQKVIVPVQSNEKYESYKDFLYRQNDEYKNDNNNQRKIYKDKITQNLLSKDVDSNNVNHSKWMNECYYCDLLK